MRKRFLHVCKNPSCGMEFSVVRSSLIRDKSAKLGISMMFHCPHCKKLQKIDLPVKRKK